MATIKKLTLCCFGLLLAGCAASPPPSPYHDAKRDAPQKLAPRPDYPGYGTAIGAQALSWDRRSLRNDFLELHFRTEWGAVHKRLLRWPDRVKIGLVGRELEAYRGDVAALVAQISAGAPDLDLSLTPAGPGDITLRTAPRAEMAAVADTALCFFTPVGMDWPSYKAAEARGEGGWEGVEEISAVTIFIPEHSAPHVFRICFVEEIMQALGPGNDLYRLEDSGFNDDEVHVAPTAFDLFMLRLLYDPSVRPGMTEAEARRAVDAILRRLVDNEENDETRRVSEYDADFQLYHYFADVRDDPKDRRELLDLANELAAKFDPDDHRIGEALRSEAYFASQRDRDSAAVDFARKAVAHFERTLPANSARLARTRADLGLFLVLDRQYDEAVDVLAKAEPWLAAHGKEDDLAASLRLRAIALAQTGQYDDAEETARDALAWAAYVFGADSLALSEWRKQFRDFDIPV